MTAIDQARKAITQCAPEVNGPPIWIGRELAEAEGITCAGCGETGDLWRSDDDSMLCRCCSASLNEIAGPEERVGLDDPSERVKC